MKAAQDAGNDAVTDRDNRPGIEPRAEIGKPGGDASGKTVIGLAVGAAEIPLPTAFFAREDFRRALPDLALVEPVPRAERDLAQPLVEMDRPAMVALVAQAFGDDLSGVPGAAERAGDDRGAFRFGQKPQTAADRPGLRDALGGQRGVEPALIAGGAVPLGLAMPDRETGPAAVHADGLFSRYSTCRHRGCPGGSAG